MALRVNESDDEPSSLLLGLSYFWLDADKSATEWNSWAELFDMAVSARHSISISEVLKSSTEQDPTISASLGNSSDVTATKKVVSLLYMSIGKTGRKMLTDKYPHTINFVIELAYMLERCRA